MLAGFILNRLLYGLAILAGVLVVVFLLFNVLPGDPAALMAGQRTDIATRAAINEELGLDKPLPLQLLHYLHDVSPLSVHKDTPEEQQKYGYLRLLPAGKKVLVLKVPYLRRSFQTNKKVTEIIAEHLAGTLWLALAAMLFATVIGIVLGVVAALKPHILARSFAHHRICAGNLGAVFCGRNSYCDAVRLLLERLYRP